MRRRMHGCTIEFFFHKNIAFFEKLKLSESLKPFRYTNNEYLLAIRFLTFRIRYTFFDRSISSYLACQVYEVQQLHVSMSENLTSIFSQQSTNFLRLTWITFFFTHFYVNGVRVIALKKIILF